MSWLRRPLLVLAVVGLAGCASAPTPPRSVPIERADTPVASGATADLARAAVPASPAPAAASEPAALAHASSASAPPAAFGTDGDAPVEVVAVDPLRPGMRIDLGGTDDRTDLWQRIRDGFAMPDLDNDHVRSRERYYARQPDYVERMSDRGSRYLFHIVEEVQRRKLPTELALLPFIESAFNPQAVSSARAAGMWQFMPATGRDFDLAQNLFRDDRRDVLASTRAALDYLQDLHRMFGDWHLALAAYNWGQGNVQRAIARNERAGRSTDYWSLSMPPETRDYVPKLQAMKNLVAKPASFEIELPPLQNHPYFLSVPIHRDIDVNLAVRLSGITAEEFRYLNPQMNKPVILAAGTPQILLPYDNANQFVRQLQQHRGPTASWTAWVAPRTVHPAEAARMVGMDERDLREVNRIPPRMLVRAGSTLLVPRADHRAVDVPEHVADNARLALAPDIPPQRRVSFRAGRKGTTVATVAKQYRVSPTQVARWNRTTARARFKPGTIVVVYVPVGKARSNAHLRDTLVAEEAPRTVKAAKSAKGSKGRKTAKAAPRGKSTAVRTARSGKSKAKPAAASGSTSRPKAAAKR